MSNILILYSTTDGHTREICQRLKVVVEHEQHKVTLASIKDSSDLDLRPFDKVVVGASIRYGKHSPLVTEFINRNEEALNAKPNAFFSVNVVARKPEKSRPETNPYMRKYLQKISWRPRQLAVFAGKIDYPSYGFFDRSIIRFIMWMTHGPTQSDAAIDFTDWRKVDEFGKLIAGM
ncbi:MAG: menaquinone-dependent protoporphyrinogen IX dehydrogenase [Sideroxyarcus sp.]|nr:menaquinone-dependent protoporphyrinogen IX dehydrogenase [Sideroxyarcus sp.]